MPQRSMDDAAVAFALAHRARGEFVDALVDDGSFMSIAEQLPTACADAPHAHGLPGQFDIADTELKP